MQVHDYVDQLTEQLIAAAALGDERTKEIAATLAAAAAPAVRLAVLSAVSAAADEITAALLDAPGSPTVGARLDGDEVAIDVRPTGNVASEEPRRDDGEPTARISLRVSEALKADVDAAAERDGVSVNTWLTRAATTALDPNPFAAFGPLAAAFGSSQGRGRTRRGSGSGDQHITGWVNG